MRQLDMLEKRFAVGAQLHAIALKLKRKFERVAYRRIVFNDEYDGLRVVHVGRAMQG